VIEQEIQAVRRTDETPTGSRRGVSRHSLRSQAGRRHRAFDDEQASARAPGAACSTVHWTRVGQLCRGEIHRSAADRFLNHVGSLACNLAELAHPVGAEREQYVGQTGHVFKERIPVPLHECAVAQERLDACPFVLGGDAGAHLEMWGVAFGTVERILFESSCSTEHREALGGPALSMVGLCFAHTIGDQAGPFGLRKVLEATRADDLEADDFGHAAVVPEEVLGASGGDVSACDGSLEGADTWPVLDGIDQIGGGRIGEGVGHLAEDVVGLGEADDGGRLGGPEVLEAVEMGVLAAGEEPVEMLGEDGEVAVGVVDACVVVVRHCDRKYDLYLRAIGGQGQAVDEGVVGVFVGAQEEAPLGTAAGDHVVATGNDLAREGHAWVLGNGSKKLRGKVPSDGVS